MSIHETATEVATKIRAITGVIETEVWTKVPGKERIYVTFMRADSRGNNFGGSGGRVTIDLHTRQIIAATEGYNNSPFFNSYTKKYHDENGTLAAILAVLSKEA